MKKLLLVALQCTVLSVHATTCPPANAFSHAGPYQDWKLDSTYQSEWRISYNPASNSSNEKTLHSGARLRVRLYPSHGINKFFEECFYEMGDVLLWIYSHQDYNINPKKLTNFHSKIVGNDTNYMCTTLAGTPSTCMHE